MSGSKNEVKEGAKTEEKAEEFDIKEIYTPLSVAKEEIWRRWNDKALRKKVEDFLGGDIPEVFKDGPRATIGRHVATPNIELFYFLDLIKEIDLIPVCLEHLQDKFVAKNKNKYHLCNLFFYNGQGRKYGDRISSVKIIDFKGAEGKSLASIKTLWGESLVDFHHKLLGSFQKNFSCLSMSDWFKKRGPKSDNFYVYYLALFITHGVLFDNYLQHKDEGNFTKNILLPNLKKIYSIFNLKPLIVPLEPINDAEYLYWYCYNESVKEHIPVEHRKNKH